MILNDKTVTTRKSCICDACGRGFDRGTTMRVVTYAEDGIYTWRECPTCKELLSRHPQHFITHVDDVFQEFCVKDLVQQGDTPEDLLEVLTTSECL